MDKVNFILGVHNHQPIGNFGFVFEKAYAQSYLPFLEAMERHPKIHWNLHATGILWEWLEKNHPDYIDRVAAQVEAGRVEILTGGYYEPILPALPEADKSGQIQKLSKYIRQRFSVKPRGLWLAERVWEPTLVKTLVDNGIDYTLLDDTHFLTTGLTADDMAGSYLTEDQGALLKILPIRQELRYAIPFKEPGETLNALRQHATPSGYKALTMFDDGEKFGLWPDTQAHVYQNGWLESFLTVLESNSDWITTARISDYLDSAAPLGRVYLPTSSYHEMGEWTLPAQAQDKLSDLAHSYPEAKPFLRGGFWRNFLTKYEESNNLHKKMLYVSKKVHAALAAGKTDVTKAGVKAQKMLDALWAGQCNCAYWHGVFGGLYLPHLRQAIYKELLHAEQLADAALTAKGALPVQVIAEDLDMDGQNEWLVQAPEQNLYFSPHAGGSLFEWDIKKLGLNMQNVLTRRREGYHRQLVSAVASGETVLSTETSGVPRTIHDIVRVKENDLEKIIHVDWYRRSSLLDHFFHPNTDLAQFVRCQYGEQGDFINTGYACAVSGDKHPQIHFTRTGTIWRGDQRNKVKVEKMISLFGPQGWEVLYRIQNVEGPTCDFWFGSEMAFAFGVPEAPSARALTQQPIWQRRDESLGIAVKVEFDAPTDLWDMPLQTVALSEEGFEKTYQGTVLVAHTKVKLAPTQTWVRSWRVGVKAL
jgi:hypothetical protein